MTFRQLIVFLTLKITQELLQTKFDLSFSKK
jgi:hypothetical protein